MTQAVLPNSIDAGTEIVASEHQQNYEHLRDIINGQLEGGSGSQGNIKANGVTARELADAILQKGVPAPNLQEGVIGAGDLKVTPGAGLTLNYAAGTAWITDDSGQLATGALLPATITGGSVVVGTAHATLPRIDQIIATLTGYNTATVSVLAGTATSGATLDNRTGAAALPNDAVRLADVLVPAVFAGPFVQNTHLRDRRPWARGINNLMSFDAGGFGVAVLSTFEDLQPTIFAKRYECSGAPIRLTIQSTINYGNAGSHIQRWLVDGVAESGGHQHFGTAADVKSWTFTSHITPTAGSHLIKPQMWSNGNSLVYLANSALRVHVQEVVAQNSPNDGA